MAVFAVDVPTLEAETESDVLCLNITMCLYGLAIPILLYFTWKYSNYQNAACIRKRRPKITISAELIAVFMFINRIIGCANAIYSDLYILRIIFVITYPMVNHSILWLCVIKYWLLYYDIQFVLFSEGNQWKCHINPHNVTYHTNWYIINKSTIGNETFLIKRFVLIIILIPIIIVPLTTFIRYTQKIDTFIDLFLMFIPLTLIIIIWYKTPKYLDYFRVREECRMLIIIGSILLIMYLIFGFIKTFLIHPHDIFIIVLCIEYMYFFGVFIGCLHLTFWTLLKNKHRLNINEEPSRLYLQYRSINRAISSSTNKSKYIYDLQNDAVILLISILENEHGFQMFLSHLLTEFCLESALAIIEFTQYQILFNQANSKTNHILKLPDIIPKSIIIYDPEKKNGIYDIKNIAKKLLQKYITNGCEHELNISYKLKKKLLTDLANIDNLSEKQLIHLFDEAISTLLLLLNDSLSRFIKTEKYKQIEKELTMNIERNNDYVKVETPVTVTIDITNNDKEPSDKPDFHTLESTRL